MLLWKLCMDDKAYTDRVYTDLSKALKSISYIKLVHKMRTYGTIVISN